MRFFLCLSELLLHRHYVDVSADDQRVVVVGPYARDQIPPARRRIEDLVVVVVVAAAAVVVDLVAFKRAFSAFQTYV